MPYIVVRKKALPEHIPQSMSEQRYRFIVADDDPEIRFFVRRIILKQYPDAQVAEAADGEAALELYDRDGADLMVIDHLIPFLNGTDLIRKLRARHASIPLVMASNLPESKAQAMTAGATFFLDKKVLNQDLGYYLPALMHKKKRE
jgi:two-component system, OmpR family, response regulator ResD